jgi:uncharacterized repeat protein (TIGR01451 family)
MTNRRSDSPFAPLRRRGRPTAGQWSKKPSAVLAAVALVVASITLVSLGTSAPVGATPGTPGVPSAPTTLYTEDFENSAGLTELENYPSASGATYTASSYWLNQHRCNGFILSSTTANPGSTYCNNNSASWLDVQRKAYALGLLNSPQDPTTNRAVSTNSTGAADNAVTFQPDGNITPNQIEFATAGQLTLPAANRFVTFSVDAAASACSLAQPLLRFYLRDNSGTEIPVSSSAINPCTDSRRTNTTVSGTPISYGRFPANGSMLLTGNSLGVVMRNEQPNTNGNDGAIDNIRVLDVTPQLDKSFSPASVPAGGTSTLTLTVTNTSELAAKAGWAFTDNLPSGLVVASPAALGGTCTATRSAPAGGSTVSISNGQLAAGQTSCTVTVNVTSSTPTASDPISKTYQNCAANISNAIGMNLPNCASVEFHRTPALTVVKSANPTTITAAGQTVTYSFLVTNTGNSNLSNIDVTESSFTGTGTAPLVTCPVAVLVPAQQETCTATYVASQSDVDAGSIKNTAVAHGTPPGAVTPVDSSPSSATVTAAATPGISLVKSASPSDAASFTVGRVITYSFVITNTGNVTLTNVHPTEGSFTGSGTLSAPACPAGAASLAPGGQVTCTATYTITQADVDNGSITNLATGTGTPPTGPPITTPPSTVTIPSNPNPAITVVKTANPTTVTTAGQTVSYSFLITNTGNVTLTNVHPTEGAFTGSGTLSAPICPAGAASLAPGGQVTCTATYTITQADVNSGSVTNTATATGTPPTGTPPVSPPSTATVTATQTPGISLVKSASPSDAASFTVGQVITYSFVITNTGNTTLTNVHPTEGSFTGSGSLSAPVCPAGAASLAPGAQVTCTATYTITQADVDNGSITNLATGTGTPPTGPPSTTPPSTVTIPSNPNPAITVVKTANPTTVNTVGDLVTYSFLITNTGNVTLTNVHPTEGAFTGTGNLSAPVCPAGAASLAPGGQVTCTATYTITQADVDTGSITNTATATGNPPTGTPPVSPPSTATVTATPAPGITVVKTANPTTVNTVGDLVTYSFLITNTGNVTLTRVGITDSAFSGSGTLPAATCPSATLAVGAFETCTSSYVVTQADVDAGTITNTATAHGTPPGSQTPTNSPPDSATVTVPADPKLTVVKSASPSSPTSFSAGQLVTYSFLVTNTGNVTLTDVTIDEGTFTGSGTLSAPVCPAGAASMIPGAQITCTATYTVTQADIDAGSITNDATATGTPPTGPPTTSPPSTVVIPEPPAPALTVTKTANTTNLVAAGQDITYSFLITNTGNVTLTNAHPTEGAFTGTGTLSAPTCPAGAASLAPGAQVICTATYTVTQADVDSGSLTNTTTATGTPPTGTPPTAPPSTVKVPSTEVGKLSLIKSAHAVDLNGDGKIDLGDRIDWSLVVTNVGVVTVTGIAVSDPTAGAVTCPATSLAPAASMTCTAPPHTVTAADAKNGNVENTAVASGVHTHTPVTSPPSTARVTIVTPSVPLAFTGVAYTSQLLYGGIGLMLIGGLLTLLGVRRRRS